MTVAASVSDAMLRYEIAIHVLEGMTRYLDDASEVVGSCADILKFPQRICDEKDSLRGTLWFSAADLNAMLAQWQVCVADAWAAWNELPGPQQAKVEPPRFTIIPHAGDFFRHR